MLTIDSSGGNLDEAIGIYNALKKYDPHITYHALIRNCTGDALAATAAHRRAPRAKH